MLSPEGLLLTDPEEIEFETNLAKEFHLASSLGVDVCCTCVDHCTCDEEIKCA